MCARMKQLASKKNSHAQLESNWFVGGTRIAEHIIANHFLWGHKTCIATNATVGLIDLVTLHVCMVIHIGTVYT